MGIRFYCPNGHRLNVKSFQAGLRGICPHCGVGVDIPRESTRPSSKEERQAKRRERMAQASREPMVPVVQKKRPPEPSAASTGEAIPAGKPVLPAARQTAAASSSPAPPASVLEEFPLFGSAEAGATTPGAAEQSSPAAGTPSTAAPSGIPAPPRADTGLTAPDPLDEAPSAVWYVRPTAGGQYGPAGREIMRVWIAEGRVGPDSLVWREGWRDWQEAGRVFPQLAPAEDEVPGLRSIIEEEVFAVGPVVSSPGGAARRASEERGNAIAAILVAALALIAVVVAVLWIWLGSGGAS